MRVISKRREPASLTAHRQTPHCNYDNYAAKDQLRNALVTEQQGLCCYCMGRIYAKPESMKIEHWKCQSNYPSEQLSYQNLLGACRGGHGQPAHKQHCDTRKGDSDINWNPADPAHHIETRIRYDLDGSISSGEADFDRQLNDILNLNLPVLKKNRKHLLDVVLHWWKSEKVRIGGPVPHDRFVRKRDWFVGGTGALSPYCQVAVWWIEQRLKRMAA